MNGAVAVDVGGTTLKGIAISDHGEIIARSIVSTPPGPDAAFAALRGLITDLTDALMSSGVNLTRIGIASPGLVRSGFAIVEYAANLGWRDLPLGTRLADEFRVPVFVENDARAGAIAEYALAPRDTRSELAFVPIGTGVAAAYFTRGALVRGVNEATGEFGHLRAVPGGEPCNCGGAGCVEVYGSAANILRRYVRGGGHADSTISLIRSLGRDPIADRVWAEAIDALAIGLGALITLLDPTLIVIGGGLSLAGDLLLEPLRERVAIEVPWRAVPTLLTSATGAHSALLGAALLGADDAPDLAGEFVTTLLDHLLQPVGATR